MSRFVTYSVVGLMSLFGGLALAQSLEPLQVDIAAQPVGDALNQFAEQSGLQVVLYADDAKGIDVVGVSGEFDDVTLALDSLLASTGLEYSFINDRTVAVASAQKVAKEGGDSDPGNGRAAGATPRSVMMAQNHTSAPQTQMRSTGNETEEGDDLPFEIEEIVVTGTSIRGVYPDSSPLFVFDAEEIRSTGSTTVAQFIQKLPQNLSSLSTGNAGASFDERNRQNVNNIDLRGLGIGATLVLLNGRRIAPSSEGRTPDVSLIPLSAVERVEVLTDGASAIYGADAVSGVVNFVMRKQLDGAHTTVGVGAAQGGFEEYRFEQSLGNSWDRGAGLIAYSYLDRAALDASDRSFSSSVAPATLSPEDTRHNILATINQEGPGRTRWFADALLSVRETNAITGDNRPTFLFFEDIEQEQYFVDLGFGKAILENVAVEVVASYSQYEVKTSTETFDDGAFVGRFDLDEGSTSFDVTAKIDGNLFEVRSGALKFSIGVGYSDDDLSQTFTFDDVARDPDKNDRSTTYAFGELLVPVVGQDQQIPGIDRLEVSLAARYTDYSDFGSNSSPKVGILWSPVPSFKLRGTFSESFRAPFLSQIQAAGSRYSLFPLAPFGFPDIWSSDGSSVMMSVQGSSNPKLGPERATSYTAGFDFSPPFIDGLTVSGTYFDIEYTDRIAIGDPTGGFGAVFAPQDFPDLLTVNPSTEAIAAIIADGRNDLNLTAVDPTDPAAVAGIVNVLLDNRIRNLSRSAINGFDLQFTHETAILNTGLQLTRILDYTEKRTVAAPVATRVDTLFNPASLRMRGFVGVARGDWSGQLNVNFVDDYVNPFADPEPAKIDTWTTVDLTTSYQFPSERSGFLSDSSITFNIQNILDEDPPFVSVGSVANQGLLSARGYDPSNASPVGRFVSLEISRKW